MHLLPREISQRSYYAELLENRISQTWSGMSYFLGFNKSFDDLDIGKGTTIVIMHDEKIGYDFEEYLKIEDPTEALRSQMPMAVAFFSSAKDPEKRNEPRTSCSLLGLVNWKWFQKHKDEPLNARSEDYMWLKKAFAGKMLELLYGIYPHLRDHLDYAEVGSPITNSYYLGQMFGGFYGLAHDYSRFDFENFSRLKAKTDVPGLYVTGQDIFVGAVTNAMQSGLLTSTAILGLPLMRSFQKFCKKVNKPEPKKNTDFKCK